jgi:hypothetical protein
MKISYNKECSGIGVWWIGEDTALIIDLLFISIRIGRY